MIRHIFIGTFKENIDDATKQKQLADMRAMKDHIPGVADLKVGLSTGWAGAENQVVMTVDFRTKADFDTYMTHPYHTDYIGSVTADAYFDRSSFVAAQFEYDNP